MAFFLEKLNKIDKPFAELTRRKTEKSQIRKIRDRKGDITTDTNEIQKTITTSYKAMLR